MSLRRARIKASASHLASLAGKRRVGAPSEETVPAPTVTAQPPQKVDEPPKESEAEKPRLKARFRPNLSESDQQRGRLRRISGCETLGSPIPNSPASGNSRTRTISTGSEPELVIASPVSSEKSLPSPLRTRKISENDNLPPPQPPQNLTPRTRKLTESSSIGISTPNVNPTVFGQRKSDHKKKFTDGIPERTKMTMFDLIYYNPSDGNRMSNASSLRSSRAASVDQGGPNEDAVVPNRLESVAERLREEAVDDVQAGTNSENDDHEDDAMPVPQVKVGADGQIILDEASTLIETTASKKAKEDLLKVPIVFENANQATNYGSWGKKKKNADWSDRDTVKFYKALSVFGTDFSLMEGVFKKRSRHELKMKFKKEEKANRSLVDKCLSQGQTFDPSIFDSDEEDQSEDEVEKKKKEKENRKKPSKEVKKRRHRIKGRRYFADSDDADESEQASESDLSIAENILQNNTQPPPPKKPKQDTSLLKSILSQGSKQFALPPALLAANPGLANASPGSLVVVASPASPASQSVASPNNAQLLEVFMVSDENGDENSDQTKKAQGPKRTRTTSESRLDTTSIGRVRTHSGTYQ